MNNFEVTPNPVRVIELENGNKLNMTRTDPYGFIYFSLERGQLPDHLKGHAFTDWSMAEIAAKKYVLERQSAVAEIKEKTPKKA
jgi:hypothetical protein